MSVRKMNGLPGYKGRMTVWLTHVTFTNWNDDRDRILDVYGSISLAQSGHKYVDWKASNSDSRTVDFNHYEDLDPDVAKNRLTITGHADAQDLGLGPGIGQATVTFTGDPTKDAAFAIDVSLHDHDPTPIDIDESLAQGSWALYPDPKHDWTKDCFVKLAVPGSSDGGATITVGLRDEDLRK